MPLTDQAICAVGIVMIPTGWYSSHWLYYIFRSYGTITQAFLTVLDHAQRI